ncbi:unnamed protein product [Eruca vesicaria subsp. sativa]|uniref:MADS-box domain-containing protein n=1 Tax=Eruca vesicaria subsp. sativa TaxID=29727 RepID=A0ABC8J7B3_ERUVS|nr:unnamed protein product [Eruca vesicaria subsp. sativa]
MVKGTKRKAVMEKITKRESAATTYTKRTNGLHSKIAQLCLLTDAQIAVLATPPSANSNRKAVMEKITKRESAATTYTKRTNGLHSKIAQLCLLTDAQIAVLATPPSANSNVSFFSFGHTSVDSIVKAYLTGGKPVREERDDDDEDLGICFARKELGLPQWWESDRLLTTKNPEELMRAMNSVLRLLAKIKALRAQDAYNHQGEEQPPPLKKMKKSNNNETVEKTEPTEQTLVLQSGSSEERVETLEYNNVLTDEELQIMSTCDSLCGPHNNNNDSLEIDFDQLIDLDLDFDFDFESLDSSDNSETLKMAGEPVDQPLILQDKNNNNNAFSTGEMSLDYSEIDIHQFSDFDLDTTSVFVDDLILESTNSALLNWVPSVDDGFVDTNSIPEQFQETTNSSSALNYYDDASALNEEDTIFSDYLTQLLQF